MERLGQFGLPTLNFLRARRTADAIQTDSQTVDPAAPSSANGERVDDVSNEESNENLVTIPSDGKESSTSEVLSSTLIPSGNKGESHVQGSEVLVTDTHGSLESHPQNVEVACSSSHTQVSETPEQESSVETRTSDRVNAWRRFIKQHHAILSARVHADELRRRSRQKRQRLLDSIKDIPSTSHDDGLGRNEEGFRHGPAWTSLLQELEDLELQVDQAEDDLVQAETALRRMMPRDLDSDPGVLPHFLENNDVVFPTGASASSASDRDDPIADTEFSEQHLSYLTKIDELNFLEEQLLELRDDRDGLRNREVKELTPHARDFLESYETKKLQLREKLHSAKSELEDLQNKLQSQSLPVEEFESPEDPQQKPLEDPTSIHVQQWLESSIHLSS